MMFVKGQKVKHDISGQIVTVAGRGHYPDTIMVETEASAGEKPLQFEVYLRHLSEIEGSTT